MSTIRQSWLRIWYWILAFLGLTPTTKTRNIPNLREVSPGVWRSGQPQDVFDWKYLKSIGVNRVVKLNFDSEYSDSTACIAGIIVHTMSIQPEGDKDLLDNITNTFVRPDPSVVEAAERLISPGMGTLVHCTHGQDRTGYLIGRYRVNHEGWSKEEAYLEMLKFGFHPELHGLHEAWEEFTPTVTKS